jgi:arylsulfatase A-like enzyme
MGRVLPSLLLVLLLASGLAAWLLWPQAEPTVVLVVLDTVRADHLSLCGYGRPTSPVLEGLADRGAAVHCRAYAPGSWTLPSHASYFTGLEPIEHGAHAITSGIDDWSGMGSRSRPLREDIPTLAEGMVARGYQALAVSGSPVVSEPMGLMRGFEAFTVSQGWGDLYGAALVPAIEALLEAQRDDRPLFLFVNIADAHQPWGAVPEGVGWLPARRRLQWNKTAPEGDWQRFVEGRMAEDEAAALMSHAVDAYDWAVLQADGVLGELLAALERGGACDAGCRLVITSDHGEYLGEYGLLDHGHHVHEANARVPVIVWDSRPGASLPSFDQPAMSALEVYDLALDGVRPARPRRSSSQAWPHARRCRHVNGQGFCSTAAALWEGEERVSWIDGDLGLARVVGDDTTPVEPLPADHPRARTITRLGERVQRDTRDDHKVEQRVTELLESLGYLD